MANFAEMNTEYEKWFTHKPARTCVAVKTLPKGVPVSHFKPGVSYAGSDGTLTMSRWKSTALLSSSVCICTSLWAYQERRIRIRQSKAFRPHSESRKANVVYSQARSTAYSGRLRLHYHLIQPPPFPRLLLTLELPRPRVASRESYSADQCRQCS